MSVENSVPDYSQHSSKIMEWQKTKSPALFLDITKQYNPMIYKVVNQYKTSGLPVTALKAHATAQFINAISTYNPDFGTNPTTHIWNHLKKVQRPAMESLASGKTPESRNMKMATYNTTRTNLEEELGREPSGVEMADNLGWSMKAVEKIERERGGEVTASNAEFPFYGNSTQFENKDMANIEYLYFSGVSDPDRVILEHTFGIGGKPIKNSKEIAALLKTNEMAVSRSKKRLADEVRKMR